MRTISKVKADKLIEKGAVVIDLRSPVDFRNGAIPNSKNLPLRNFLNELVTMKSSTVLLVGGSTDDDADIKSALNYAEQRGFLNVYSIGSIANWLSQD